MSVFVLTRLTESVPVSHSPPCTPSTLFPISPATSPAKLAVSVTLGLCLSLQLL